MSIRPSGRVLWIRSTAPGLLVFVVSSLLLDSLFEQLVAALVVAVVAAFSVSARLEKRVVPGRGVARLPHLEALARATLGRSVAVVASARLTGDTVATNLIRVPSAVVGSVDEGVVFAHELGHLRYRDTEWRLPLQHAVTVFAPNLFLVLPGEALLRVAGAVVVAFLVDVAAAWFAELRADVFAVRWGLSQGLFVRADYLARRLAGPGGLSRTHPPRWMRVQAVRVA